MTGLAKWNAPSAWAGAGFTLANFNSLAGGSCVVAATPIANGTALDVFADFSFSFVVGGTTTASSFLTLFLLPLNQDGTTYGDNTPTGTTPPTPMYQAAIATVLVGVTSGNAIVGMFQQVPLPPGSYLPVIANNLGITFNSAAAAAVQYRAYEINNNG